MEPAKLTKTLMKRLPLYLEYLQQLPEQTSTVSATVIADALGLGNVLVRKDLAKISGEGRCRTGRSRAQLIRDIREYLDYACSTSAIVVGTGVMPEARFTKEGLQIIACFDPNPTANQTVAGRPVHSLRRLESFCKYYHVHIGILTVSPEYAQSACDGLIACGIRNIWNCTDAKLSVPEGIRLCIPQ